MAHTLLQKYYFTIPATVGTQIYSYNFKSDELYNFLSGIACPLATALPTTVDSIEVELRDDFKSILSFSPYQNWIKETQLPAFDLTEVFTPLSVESKGKNFYLNVKVTNSSTAFSFVALFRQSMEQPEIKIFGEKVESYDMQAFTIKNADLGANYEITLPSDFYNVAGVNFIGGDSTNFYNVAIDINDSLRELLDPIPITVLHASASRKNGCNFYPLSFQSANKQINIRLSPLYSGVSWTPSDITVTFILTR